MSSHSVFKLACDKPWFLARMAPSRLSVLLLCLAHPTLSCFILTVLMPRTRLYITQMMLFEGVPLLNGSK